MDLLNRYLQAVRFWLPKRQKHDIIAELSDDIRSQIDEKESELGRALDDAELAAVLKRSGPPVLVAGRYHPQGHLIGPLLFPVYRFVLKLALFFYFVPWLVIWFVLVAFVPSYRAAHPGPELLKTLGTWWNSAFYAFGLITVGFAVAERIQTKSGLFERWDPRKLPVVRERARISRATSIPELVTDALFALWWLGVLRLPAIYVDKAAHVLWTPGPVWDGFHNGMYTPILLLVLAGMAVSSFNLIRPRWTRLRLGTRAGLNFIGAVVLGLVLGSHLTEVHAQWVSSRTTTLPKAALLSNWTNIGIYMTLLVAALICFCSCVYDIYRAVRLEKEAESVSKP